MEKTQAPKTPIVRTAGETEKVAVVSRYPVDVDSFVYGSDEVNEGVRELQHALTEAGVEVKVDGVYGYATRQAIIAFQVKSGLGGMQANGDLLPRTLDLLFPAKD